MAKLRGLQAVQHVFEQLAKALPGAREGHWVSTAIERFKSTHSSNERMYLSSLRIPILIANGDNDAWCQAR